MTFKLRRDLSRHTTLAYRNPPTAGNRINGLDEQPWRPASHVFHNDGSSQLEWDQLDQFFSYINPWRVVLYIFKNIWNLRKSPGPAAAQRREVSDPTAMSREIKKLARELGTDLVGITTIKPEYIYQDHQVPYRYVISIGVEMNRRQMRSVPDIKSATEVMRAYERVGFVVSKLSHRIRRMGWAARSYGNPNSGDLLQIPPAIDAGLGQLGKHGSLISREHGSNFRLGCVVTDLPMSIDAPVDIGVDDLCSVCNVCVRDCPVDAIHDTPQLVRGTRKWYVDFDKCIPYFCETYGCGICIEVCPWSEADRGPWLSEKLLPKRESGATKQRLT